MLSAVSYFNPWVDKGTLRDFNQIETWQKVGAVALTALESITIVYLASQAGLAALCVSLPVAGLCAIATFRALVTLAASQIPPTQFSEPQKKTGAEIKNEHYKTLILQSLKLTERLGTAIDNGDCFYDAIAQLLEKEGIEASVESLRRDIGEALRVPKWEDHIRKKLVQDPRGMGSFDKYAQYVSYAHAEISKTEEKDPIWGDSSREGVILCEKYQFNLRVLKAGFNENVIFEANSKDSDLRTYLGLKSDLLDQENPNEQLLQEYEEQIQTRYRPFYENPANYYTEEEIVPKGSPYTRTLTLALFNNHFVPVFTR